MTTSNFMIRVPSEFNQIMKDMKNGKIVPLYEEQDEEGPQYGRDAVQRWRGFLFDEWNKDLSGNRAYRIYREMRDECPAVSAVVMTLENFAKKVTWQMVPASKPIKGKKTKKWAAEAQRWADFAQSCIEDMAMTWEQCLEQFVSAVWQGFYYGEVVYKTRTEGRHSDGLIAWSRFVNTGAQYVFEWVYDEKDQQIIGLVQNPPNGASPTAYIPKEKALHIVFSSENGSPTGRSCLRAAYSSWKYLKNLRALEGVGYEKDVGGIPIARVPSSMLSSFATTDDAATLNVIKSQLAGLRKGAQSYLIYPSRIDAVGETGYDFSFAQTSQSGANAAIDVAIRRYQEEIARAVLAEYMYLGSGSQGSWALSSDKTSNFIESVRGMLDTIAAMFTRQCVSRLMQINGVDPQYWPSLSYTGLDRPDLTKIGEYVTRLASAGVSVTDEETVRWLRQIGGLPDYFEEPADATSADGGEGASTGDSGDTSASGDGKMRASK